MPADGYTAMFERMFSHPNIEVRISTEYRTMRASGTTWDHLVFSGPIDEYFDHRLGKLPYRSLQFVHEHLPEVDRFQSTGTINYPNEQDFTRITEFKYLTGEDHLGTSIVREYPTDDGDPYYPVPRAENEALFKQYQALADVEPDVTFVGRLAQYRYYNMDQVVGAALAAIEPVCAAS
jgi:UDP-galactopyranose mutase